ncbi:hypothetical protein L596_019059 [Steinernema carpocapsae]|uniref:tRNA/rRNA methyltransferase SpoU type domain-containing protein n=1 Tax=Steinernema carpocapsae TaxID=34508 RepID=A0A4U5N6Z8_STECR|nr:hypothetical protein L596_019059 [Steinernema carpocapsae]
MNTDIKEICAQRSISIKSSTTKQLDNLAEYQLHNGICADVSPLPIESLSTEIVGSSQKAAYLYLDGILDPGNIGAIVRSATFFGANGIVWAASKGPKRLTSSMSKASSGALEHFPVFCVESITEMYELLRPLQFSFIGTVDEEAAARKGIQTQTLANCKISPRSVIIMGHEQKGIADEYLKLCDTLVTIPRSDKYRSSSVASLNVSVATGLLLHQWSSRDS